MAAECPRCLAIKRALPEKTPGWCSRCHRWQPLGGLAFADPTHRDTPWSPITIRRRSEAVLSHRRHRQPPSAPTAPGRIARDSKQYSRDYHDPKKRSIANQLQVTFKDGTKTRKVPVEYPVGHRRRRAEGIPLLEAKFRTNLARRFAAKQRDAILALCRDAGRLEATPVHEFVDKFVI